MKKYLFLSFLTLFGYVGIAAAATPQILGEYGDWIAYYYRDNAGPVCYMASTPKKDEGKYSKRGDIFVVVTHRPNEKVMMLSILTPDIPIKRMLRSN